MALADRPSGAPEPPAAVRGTWVGDELQRALSRIDAMARSLEAAQAAIQLQQQEIGRLQEALRTVDGRTQRHEAGQEAAREVRQELAGMTQSIEAESSLRRDLAARVERAAQREYETQRELQRVMEQIATRLNEFDERQASTAVRERHLVAEATEQEREDVSVGERLLQLEREVTVAQEVARHAGEEVARGTSGVPELVTRMDDLTARVRALQIDQQRIVEDVAAVRAVRDREETVLDILEQQRTTRARVEERLNEIEETMEATRRAQEALAERIALLDREQSNEEEQHRALLERIEAQRDTLTEHMRRAVLAEEDSARRRVDEIEREVRMARGLLVRLQEQAGDAGQETPL